MSHDTIRQYIWRDKAEGDDLWYYLRQARKQRRKQTPYNDITKVQDRVCCDKKADRQNNYILNKKTISLIGRDSQAFKMITSDNGTEFHQYKKIEARCNVKFYFTNPYHS